MRLQLEDAANCVVTLCQHGKTATESFSVFLSETGSRYVVRPGQSAGIRV